MTTWYKQAFLVSGVIVAFSVFGTAMETTTRTDYDGERFKAPVLLVVLQSGAGALVAFTVLKIQGLHLGGGVPFQKWLMVAIAYVGALSFSTSALKYLPYPTQVVFKACKPIPVLLGEAVLAGVSHTLAKKISVLLMVAGLIGFTWSGQKAKSSTSLHIEPADLAFGVGLVSLGLVGDGIYGPMQSRIMKKHHEITSLHLMFNLNVFSTFLALGIAAVNGDLDKGTDFISRHPSILRDLAKVGGCAAVGQLFIFALQRECGALTVTLATTLRKLLSVVISVIFFGHSLSTVQWICVAVVMLSGELSNRFVHLLRVLGLHHHDSTHKKHH